MAKRQGLLRVQTPVQGDDAWVEMTMPTVKEIEAILAREDDAYSTFSVGKDIIVKHVRAWNWVGFDDEPLPPPSENPDIVNDLTTDEYKQLLEKLLGGEEERKN